MHMTAMRHQWRTYHRLAESRNAGDEGPLAVVRLDGHTDRELPSTAEIHFIQESVEATWENARRALEASGLDGGDRGGGGPALRLVVARLAQQPARPAETERSRRAALEPSAGAGPAGAGADGRGRVVPGTWRREHVQQQDECGPRPPGGRRPRHGPHLHRAGAGRRGRARGATARRGAARTHQGGRAVGAAGLHRRIPAGSRRRARQGHGPAAKVLVERYFKNAGRLHFLHVEPDQAEANKPDAEGDLAARAEERTELELQLCLGALHPMPVGPRLERALAPHLRTPEYEHLAPVRVDPGFDGGTLVIPPRPGEIPEVLFLGRLEDAPIQGTGHRRPGAGQSGRGGGGSRFPAPVRTGDPRGRVRGTGGPGREVGRQPRCGRHSPPLLG